MISSSERKTLEKLYEEVRDMLEYSTKIDNFEREHLEEIKEYLKRILD